MTEGPAAFRPVSRTAAPIVSGKEASETTVAAAAAARGLGPAFSCSEEGGDVAPLSERAKGLRRGRLASPRASPRVRRPPSTVRTVACSRGGTGSRFADFRYFTRATPAPRPPPREDPRGLKDQSTRKHAAYDLSFRRAGHGSRLMLFRCCAPSLSRRRRAFRRLAEDPDRLLPTRMPPLSRPSPPSLRARGRGASAAARKGGRLRDSAVS
jgi:hypothetical protein